MTGRAKTRRSKPEAGQTGSQLSSVLKPGTKGTGHSLDKDTRNVMEKRFNYDFSAVRVHDDSQAADSARDVNAHAYTVGSDIVFGANQYQPHAGEGQRLVAHELAHVVQQGRGTQAPAPIAGSNLERDADRAASDFSRGTSSIQVSGSSGPGLARVVAPRALQSGINPSSMSPDEISREISLIERWLKDNPNGPEATRLSTTLGKLKEELASRPPAATNAGSRGTTQAAGELRSAQLRFPLPRANTSPSAAQTAPPAPTTLNTPPPVTHSPSLESMLPPASIPAGTSALDRDLMGLGQPGGGKGAGSTSSQAQPVPAKQEKKPTKEAGGGLGTQAGTGTQTGLNAPHKAFQYVQVTVEWSNKYVVSLDEKSLPPFLSNYVRSISFIGEPGLALQYHVLGSEQGNIDAQFLLKLAQISMRAVDISLVGGGQFTDLGKKWDASRLTPLTGIEVETKIAQKGPVKLSWVLDGLAAFPQAEPPAGGLKAGQPAPGREFDAQFSGELRLGVEW
jgi:Domain of unknown function (DUF4157)